MPVLVFAIDLHLMISQALQQGGKGNSRWIECQLCNKKFNAQSVADSHFNGILFIIMKLFIIVLVFFVIVKQFID
jgi:hypothetical protein